MGNANDVEEKRMMRTVRRHAKRMLCAAMLAALGVPVAQAACSDAPGPRVDWTQCQKGRLILRGANLENARLASTDLGRSDLSGAKLAAADLERAAIDSARLIGADLSRAKMIKVNGYRANLSEAKLAGADLTKAEMQRANLTKADLTGANLSKAELARANLRGARLEGARLERAELARAELNEANLIGANLKGAHFFLTRIEGVDLSKTLGLVQRQLDDACGDASTKLPAGLKAPAAWPCPSDD
jgi:uncharacterized protein YjbI with pentapeptide repeats